jgi:aldehyde dehydrogenase (NAD+)
MEEYDFLIQKQRAFYMQGKTKSISFRIEMLNQLRNLIKTNEKTLMDALKQDLNKSEFDSYF